MIRTIFVPFEWNCVLLKILSIRIMFMDNFLTMEKCVREVGEFAEYATQCGRSTPEEWAKYSRWPEIFFRASPFMDFQEKNGGQFSQRFKR